MRLISRKKHTKGVTMSESGLCTWKERTIWGADRSSHGNFASNRAFNPPLAGQAPSRAFSKMDRQIQKIRSFLPAPDVEK